MRIGREAGEGGTRYGAVSELPDVVPIFPLTGALLLPRARLPLHIFEPRYLAMVDAALAGERFIGMIQPREGASDKPALYPAGCLGRLTSFNETADNRYYITLTGVCRFRPRRELDAITPYRQVMVDYTDFVGDLVPANDGEIDRPELIAAVRGYFEKAKIKSDWETIEQAPAETLVNSLSVFCPFEPPEKQALLEAATLAERARALIALIRMAMAREDDGGDRTLQ